MRAEDVRAAHSGVIWWRGKQREEHAPILGETLAILMDLTADLEGDAPIFRDQRGRDVPLGYEGTRKMIAKWLKAAGLNGFRGHDLRRSFATLVAEESGDEVLAMRLLRDQVPGVGSRYVKRDLPKALETYSPLRQLKDSPASADGRVP